MEVESCETQVPKLSRENSVSEANGLSSVNFVNFDSDVELIWCKVPDGRSAEVLVNVLSVLVLLMVPGAGFAPVWRSMECQSAEAFRGVDVLLVPVLLTIPGAGFARNF